jgi:hypothetical protein|tara:strand:+ start:49 stop:294 length:246 start_codon:yes stop_codon:yes gene_type:complete
MKITKSQLRQIIKEEVQKALTESYKLFYKDDGGESGIIDINADTDDEALEAASGYVSRLAQKTGQKFGIEKLLNPEGERVV